MTTLYTLKLLKQMCVTVCSQSVLSLLMVHTNLSVVCFNMPFLCCFDNLFMGLDVVVQMKRGCIIHVYIIFLLRTQLIGHPIL